MQDLKNISGRGFIDKLNEVLASKKSFISDSLNFSSLGLGALLNIIHWVILYIKIRPSSDNILLHYNVVTGADVVSKAQYIYFIPATALAILIFNAYMASNFFKKEKLAGYFLNISSIAVQVIFLVASVVLIIANAQ